MGKRIKTVLVKRLLQEYPPKHFWACDDIAIEEKWAPALKNRKMKDDRDKREDSTYLLDEAEFRDAGGIVFENESVIYRDETTKEVVGVVIRNLINHPGLLEWLDSRVKLACKERRYSRRDDAGCGVNIGYSSGPRSAQKLTWTETIKTRTEEELLDRTKQDSSACAYIWNKARERLPPEVVADFEDLAVPRMDFNSDKHEKEGPYQVWDGQNWIQKEGVYGPCAAFVGDNYARFCHNEKDGNRFVVALTTHRSVPSDRAEGGHFYIAAYGIQIRSAADTLTAFDTQNWHGTTLQNTEPIWGKVATGRFQQRGWALLIQNTIPGFSKRDLEAEEAEEAIASKEPSKKERAPIVKIPKTKAPKAKVSKVNAPKAKAPPKKLSRQRKAAMMEDVP
ncbi:MAG: hypothetical protein LQ352_007037 [Teloschistes flavicans]|nr:MAG: hypothetical protein LQ352_007037 [Teloschistes flavicans]